MTANGISDQEWRSLREKVLERDGYQCQRCEKGEEKAESLHAHHSQPVSEGGSHDIDNLRIVCESCHHEIHAEERRTGTLEDIRDIFLSTEVPVFRTKEIDERLPGKDTATTAPKLQKLVEEGFLKKGDRGVYFRSDLEIESMNLADSSGIIVEGSYIEDGEYIGHEDQTAQCQHCNQWLHSKNVQSLLKRHKKQCSEYNNIEAIKAVKESQALDFRDEKVVREAVESDKTVLLESELQEFYRENTEVSAESTLSSRICELTREGPFERDQCEESKVFWRLVGTGR